MIQIKIIKLRIIKLFFVPKPHLLPSQPFFVISNLATSTQKIAWDLYHIVLYETVSRKRLATWTSANAHPHSYHRFAWFGESPMWILTPPWLLFSLRGRRKRCQHDPGSRLWRGSGGKSKAVHLVASQQHRRSRRVFLSPRFLPRSLSRSAAERADDSSLWGFYCFTRGSKRWQDASELK